MALAVFDIDGVVADVRHRLHHLEGPRRDWNGFFALASADHPLLTGVQLVLDAAGDGLDIVWLTGRPNWLRTVTSRWLVSNGLPAGELRMRSNRDYRPARVMKVAVLRELAPRQISVFVDDDPDVVRAADEAGFPARLADWVPHSKTLTRAQERDGRT